MWQMVAISTSGGGGRLPVIGEMTSGGLICYQENWQRGMALMVPLISSYGGDILMRCSDILIRTTKTIPSWGKCVGWSINEDAPGNVQGAREESSWVADHTMSLLNTYPPCKIQLQCHLLETIQDPPVGMNPSFLYVLTARSQQLTVRVNHRDHPKLQGNPSTVPSFLAKACVKTN